MTAAAYASLVRTARSVASRIGCTAAEYRRRRREVA